MERDRRYRAKLGDELRTSVKMLLALLGEGHNSIDDNSPQLERFCLVLEKAFLHGLQESMWGRTKYYWDFIQNLPKVHPPGANSIDNVLALSQVRTSAGRGRAWIRFALIEKKLEKYVRLLVSRADLTAKWYEPYALFRVREDCDMFLGFLAPLAMVDFSICLKDIDFDNLPTDLSLYPVDSLGPPPSSLSSAAAGHITPSQQQPTAPDASSSEEGNDSVNTEEVAVRSRKDREKDKAKQARQKEAMKWQQLIETKDVEWKKSLADLEESLVKKEALLQEQAAHQIRLTDLEDKLRAVTDREQAAQLTVDSLRAQLKESEAKLSRQNALESERLGMIEALNQERLLLEAKLHQHQEEIRLAESRLSEQAEELARLTGARNALQQRLNEADETMWQRVQQMTSETDQERNRLSTIEAEHLRTIAEHEATRQELQRVRDELGAATDRMQQLERDLVQATDEHTRSATEAPELREELERMRTQSQTLETERLRLSAEIATLSAERERALQLSASAEAEVSSLRLALKDAQDKQLKSEKEGQDLRECIAQLTDASKSKDGQLKRLEDELKETRREKEKYARQLETATRERELEGMGKEESEIALKGELHELQQRLESLIRQEEQYKEQIERQALREKELTDSFELERQQLRKDHEEKLSLLQNRIKVKDVMVEKKSRELEDALRERDDLQEKLRLALEAREKDAEEHIATVSQLQLNLSTDRQHHEQQMSQAKAQLLSLECELREGRRKAEDEIEALRKEVAEQTDVLHQKQARIDVLEADAGTASTLRQQLDTATARIEDGEARLNKLSGDIEFERSEREKLKQERDTLKEEKKKKEKDLEGLMKLLLAKESRIAELQREADESVEGRRIADQEKKSAVDRLHAIETELNQLEQSQMSLQKQHLEQIVDLQRNADELRRSNSTLQRKLEKRTTKIRRLKQLVQNVDDQEQTKALMAQMRSQIDELLQKAHSSREAQMRAESRLAQYQRDSDALKQELIERSDKLALAEREQHRAVQLAEEQAAQIVELKKILERKEETIKDSKQLINDRERRLRELMNRDNRDPKGSSSDEGWVVLDDHTQHRLLDDMRNVLAVTKQMVEEKAHEIDGLQDQLQERDARVRQLQATIDNLQHQLALRQEPIPSDTQPLPISRAGELEAVLAERDALQLRYNQDVGALQTEVNRLKTAAATLMEQSAVLKRLLALQGNGPSGSSRSAPSSPVARTN